MPDKSNEKLQHRRSSRNANCYLAGSDDETFKDSGMRIGQEYQAHIPDYNPYARYEGQVEAVLVWAPSLTLPDVKVDDYLQVAKDLHDYNMEQALGMLFWHKYNIERALSDLPNFTPFLDDWSIEDKVLFEQAFGFYGKSFHQIKMMLPDKSISALVKHFYSWKGIRSRSSVMDRQAKRFNNGEDSDGGLGRTSSCDEGVKFRDREQKKLCVSCGTMPSQLRATPQGSMCHVCYHYRRRTGVKKSAGGKQHGSQGKVCHNLIDYRQNPPRGIYLDLNNLLAMVSDPPEAVLKYLDSELVSLKRIVQNNKQILSQQKHKILPGIEEFRPPEPSFRISARWTNAELLLAVQGVRTYGKDFKVIAELIGNKTEAHIRSFFVTFCHRYNLNEVLEEYKAENEKSERLNAEMKDETDNVKAAENKMEVNMTKTTLNGTANISMDSCTPLEQTNNLKLLQPAAKDSKKLPYELGITLSALVTRTTPASTVGARTTPASAAIGNRTTPASAAIGNRTTPASAIVITTPASTVGARTTPASATIRTRTTPASAIVITTPASVTRNPASASVTSSALTVVSRAACSNL